MSSTEFGCGEGKRKKKRGKYENMVRYGFPVTGNFLIRLLGFMRVVFKRMPFLFNNVWESGKVGHKTAAAAS